MHPPYPTLTAHYENLNIGLQLHHPPSLSPPMTATRVAGITLTLFGDYGEDSGLTEEACLLIVRLIKALYSHLAAFSQLQHVEVRAHLAWLRRAVERAPEISQLPDFGERVRYRWACNRADLPYIKSEEYFIGVDPATLELTGR